VRRAVVAEAVFGVPAVTTRGVMSSPKAVFEVQAVTTRSVLSSPKAGFRCSRAFARPGRRASLGSRGKKKLAL